MNKLGIINGVRREVKVLGNIESILGKMEQDGHLEGLYQSMETILRKETDFAIKGELNRAEENEAEIAWTGSQGAGEDQWGDFQGESDIDLQDCHRSDLEGDDGSRESPAENSGVYF